MWQLLQHLSVSEYECLYIVGRHQLVKPEWLNITFQKIVSNITQLHIKQYFSSYTFHQS